MAVYRVQRTRDYTVMSNYHLKDKGLTLKSKGLLSMILSLPEEWNYTTRAVSYTHLEKTLRQNTHTLIGDNQIIVAQAIFQK